MDFTMQLKINRTYYQTTVKTIVLVYSSMYQIADQLVVKRLLNVLDLSAFFIR